MFSSNKLRLVTQLSIKRHVQEMVETRVGRGAGAGVGCHSKAI